MYLILAQISITHLFVVMVVAVVIFGSSRLPNMTKNIIKSLRIFNTEMRKIKDENKDNDIKNN